MSLLDSIRGASHATEYYEYSKVPQIDFSSISVGTLYRLRLRLSAAFDGQDKPGHDERRAGTQFQSG